jgi:hypothetical protein
MRFLLALVVALACASAQAQPTRVRGTISGFDGKTLTVDGKTKVLVGEKTEIVFTQPITLADIKPGDFLGVTSTKGPGGQLTAYEVRRFPKPLNPGHRPFDGRDDQTMTNATVGAMVQATLVPGTPKQLAPGAPVNLTHDAGNVALRIQVGPKAP